MPDYSILIGGAAGQGSRKAGLLIARLFNNLGYRVFIHEDYQSLIKGGHNFSQIRVSDKETFSHREKIDFLLALDKNTIEKHQKDLVEKGLTIYNSDEIYFAKFEKGIGISLQKIIKEAGGLPIMENTALIAAFAKIIGIDWEIVEDVLKKEFQKEAEINLKIAKRTYEKIQAIKKIEKINQKPLPLLTGNEAVALGAVKAGLEMYFAYPMTPTSPILHYLAEYQNDFNIKVLQLENEIAVINTAIGAAYTGARTMVGTAGGGFALMTEGLSLAAQSETPIVIVEGQRMAPATGVPTYSAQGDLMFTLSAGHGDFVRFVIAPGDADEAFYFAGKALNLAWKYQTPVILLLDKDLCESTFVFHPETEAKVKIEEPLLWNGKEDYKRYKITENGVSPLAFPGKKDIVVKTTSYEHDEMGITVEEDESAIKKMQEKRLRKFKEMEKEVEKTEGTVKVYGNENSKEAIVAWGSTKGAAKEAAEKLGIKMIQPIFLEPFPKKEIKKALKGVEKLIFVEMNSLGQLEKLFKSYGIKGNGKILKYNGRPFTAEEIEKELISKSKKQISK